MKNSLNIMIFRNNLRIKDNDALFNAFDNKTSLLCLYSLELLKGNNLGLKKCGKFRKEFIYESLLELKENLFNKNIALYIVEDIEKSLELLNKKYHIKLFFNKEVGIEEKEFEKKLEKYTHQSFFSQTMIKAFDFDYKKSFSHFNKKAQKQVIQELCSEISSKENLFLDSSIKDIKINTKNINKIKGGESQALKRVNFYLENFMHKYLDTRSLFSGKDISTGFSAYLSSGCISARQIYFKIKEHEKQTCTSKSSYWIYYELLWRDFFHLVMLQSSNKLFLKGGILEADYDFKNDKKELKRIFTANTKVDIIDAAVVELKTTGNLSNRARQILSNYFVKVLGLDFRYCAAFFEKYLIDYNPASNYGNFAYQAGVGNDKSYRIFDPYKQSKLYNGKAYIKKYLNKNENQEQEDYKLLAENVKKEIFKIKDEL